MQTNRAPFTVPPMIPLRAPSLSPLFTGANVSFSANTWSVMSVKAVAVGDDAGTTVVEGTE